MRWFPYLLFRKTPTHGQDTFWQDLVRYINQHRLDDFKAYAKTGTHIKNNRTSVMGCSHSRSNFKSIF
ncbi:hypothetical protein Plhal304r1_c057g0143411 [Plasmopara halstedii]